MKNTGITREVDSAGRIVLPMELRRNMGINAGDALEISVDGGNIVLSPVAVPLTREDLKSRIGKPVFWRLKNELRSQEAPYDRFGWVVLDFIDEVGFQGTDDNYYSFSRRDFYDREVQK